MTIASPAFKLSRQRYVRAATIYFVRRYALFYILSVVAGCLLMALQRNGFGLVIGLILVVYPFTVPVRYAMAVSSRARNLFDHEHYFEITEDEILIRNSAGGTTIGKLSSVRDVSVIDGMLVLLFGRGTFLIVPLDQLQEQDRAEAIRRAQMRGA